MKTFLPILMLILAILYIASPYDLLPDLMPVLGWIDDTAILALMFYYFRNGKFPDFVTRFFRNVFGAPLTGPGPGNQRENRKGNGGSAPGGGFDTRRPTPHSILGVRPGASQDEIHSAYRRLAHQYHPDKVSHLGAEFQKIAERKFIEIQDAYEALTGRKP